MLVPADIVTDAQPPSPVKAAVVSMWRPTDVAIESRYRFRLSANAKEFLHRNDRYHPVSNRADMCDFHDGLHKSVDVFCLCKDFNLGVFCRPVVGEEIRVRAESPYSGNSQAMNVNGAKLPFQYFHCIGPNNGNNAFQLHVALLND